jgi:hypothetical protein
MATQAIPATVEMRALARMLQKRKAAAREKQDRVGEAIADPLEWAQRYTKTYNEHWVEEGRPSPYEPFPKKHHFRPLFEVFQRERIILIEKSRDMMVSWACVAYLTWEAMRTPERGIVLQTQKEDKVKQLIDYAKCLYRNQPDWLKEAFPLAKPLDSQPDLSLEFAHGGNIMGIPGGADKIRSYHPWGYLNDESSFQPEAGDCYNEALAAAKGKIIFNSSAGPGWYADYRRDIVLNTED